MTHKLATISGNSSFFVQTTGRIYTPPFRAFLMVGTSARRRISTKSRSTNWARAVSALCAKEGTAQPGGRKLDEAHTWDLTGGDLLNSMSLMSLKLHY